MRFIHTADNHIGAAPSRRLFPARDTYLKRLNECEDAFFRLLEQAASDDYEAVIIAGDWFDHPRVSRSTLKRLEAAITHTNIPIVVILGNHDAFAHEARFSVLQHPLVHLLTKESPSVVIGDVTFVGQATHVFDYERLTELLTTVSTPQTVLLLHGDIQNAKDDHYLTSLAKLKKLPVDYLALGHIHQHAFLAPHIAYSGNLEPHDPSETGQKGFISVDLSAKQFTFVPTASREVRHLTFHFEEEDLSQIAKTLIEEVLEKDRQTHLYRLTLTGNKPIDEENIERLEARLNEAFYAYELRDERTPNIDKEALLNNYQNTVIATLLEADTGDDDEALALALEALLETEERR